MKYWSSNEISNFDSLLTIKPIKTNCIYRILYINFMVVFIWIEYKSSCETLNFEFWIFDENVFQSNKVILQQEYHFPWKKTFSIRKEYVLVRKNVFLKKISFFFWKVLSFRKFYQYFISSSFFPLKLSLYSSLNIIFPISTPIFLILILILICFFSLF